MPPTLGTWNLRLCSKYITGIRPSHKDSFLAGMETPGTIPGPSVQLIPESEATSPIQIFGPDSNVFSAPHTQKLLQSIREHLCRKNSNTRARYDSVVNAMSTPPHVDSDVVGEYSKLPDSKPDNPLIMSYFCNEFPNVQLQDRESDLKEGQSVLGEAVSSEGSNQDNTIRLKESVVCALEWGDEKVCRRCRLDLNCIGSAVLSIDTSTAVLYTSCSCNP